MLAGGTEAYYTGRCRQDLQADCTFHFYRSVEGVRFRLIKTGMDSLSVKVQELLFWKNWNMRNNVVQKSMQRLSDTVQPVMRITLLLLQKMEAVQQKQWNLRWKKQEVEPEEGRLHQCTRNKYTPQ